MKYSFEEFKLYYESTERVTDRRIANNQWNYSVCVATIVAIALVWNWSVSNRGFAFLSLTIVAALSALGILFSSFWVRQITDYKSLNSAKFDVLNDIAPKVAFTTTPGTGEVVSSNAFKREWELLENRNALRKIKRGNLIALKGSTLELYLPMALRAMYVLCFIVSVTPIFRHPVAYLRSWANWLHVLKP